MSSTASPQTSTPAPNAPATVSAPSYASAAGAGKKPSLTTPLVALGTHAPVVAGGPSGPAQHAKTNSVNSRPIMPAVPVAAPAVAHGTSSANGVADSHSRKPSVTMSANGPSTLSVNGGAKNIQFGYASSPAPSHSTPHAGSAPIPIPGAGGNPPVRSPQHSPSPIPQPSASGGRPPSNGPQGNTVTFGSFGGSSENHMRPSSASQSPAIANTHIRNESAQSMVTDRSNQGGPPARGSFHQPGRGRGGYNPNQQHMGYPPNGNPPFRGHPTQGRGAMAPAFQPGRPPSYVGTPPSRSPAMPPAMPHMPQGPPNMGPGGPGFYYQPPAMNQPMPQYPYQPQFDPMRQGMPMPYQMYPPQMGQMQTHSPGPNYTTPFVPPGQYHPQGAPPMSRNSSQISEQRPASSTGQHQSPAIVHSTPQQHPIQTQPAVVQSPQFSRPARKSVAISIKDATGKVIDLTSLKAPASPAPSSQTRTPPVVASTPTPPPKSSTPKTSAPVHARTDSTTTKTQAEVQNEFREKIARQIADGSKNKEVEEAKAAAEKAATEKAATEKAAADKVAAEKAAAEKAAAEKAAAEAKAAEEKAKEDERLKAEQKAREEAKAKEEAAAKAKAEAEAEAAKASEKKTDAAAPVETEEDEMDRMIREMEEAEAKREAEEKAYAAQKKAEAEKKKAADVETRKTSAADNDRKLREAEAEAERQEEEKERRRKEAEASGTHVSVADLLAGKKPAAPSPKETASATNDAASKLASLTIHDKPVAGAKHSPGEKRGTKPPPLNLSTKAVEPPQPSAALTSLKTSRLMSHKELLDVTYPAGISLNSPNPALNAAVSKKGTSFKYDPNFLMQFKNVFTEQPSLEFHQQVKNLIGDGDGGRSASARTPSTRQGSRGGSNFPAMGSMGSFGTGPTGRTLPPGTTSSDRFNMSSGGLARPNMSGPMANFQRGAFPSQLSRTPSSHNMGTPHSPRQGSRRTSRRDGGNNARESQAAKTMPLTQGMKIETLVTSTSGWKPMSLSQKTGSATPSGHMDPQTVQRKVKAALNKLTPENFDRISQQILDIAAQSKDESDGRTLRQVIQLTFEKATDESHWASMYAKFCKRMLESMSAEVRDEGITDKNGNVVSGGALFRKYLLNRCQEEFERGWATQLPEPPEGDNKESHEAVMLSDEYYVAAAAKRRGLGLVQFIGELFKLGMLTERIMHECVKKLLDYDGIPDEAEVESLCKLLRTIGANLDSSERGPGYMDVYFTRIHNMIAIPELNSRLKFMLMDVVDLRRMGWVSKEGNKGPKTLEEVRAEAEAQAAQKAAEAARSNTRGDRGSRMQMGRGDARQFSSGYAQANQNQVGMDDLRRLKGAANRSSSQHISLGPTSMFSSRSNSGRRLGPGGSLSHRGADDSNSSSRTGTPAPREQSHNQYSLLANMEDNPASPPSTAASPALSKATPETVPPAKGE